MSTQTIDGRPLWSADIRGVHLGWLAAAAVVSFFASAVFAGLLEMPRAWFLVPYLGFSAAFVAAYVRATRIDLAAAFREHWGRGVVAAIVAGVFLVQNVRAQPALERSQGMELVFQIAWFGLAYGLIDALMLSVVPVMAIEHAFHAPVGTGSRVSRLGIGVAALIASMGVAAVYHLGFPEFRNATLLWPIIGNGVITLSYLLSRSPVAPVLAHIIMHVAAVFQGPDGTVQLPPHY